MSQDSIAVFGCDVDEFVKNYVYGYSDPANRCLTIAMSLLSDSQEDIVRSKNELARQRINLSKYLISLAQEATIYGTLDGVPLSEVKSALRV